LKSMYVRTYVCMCACVWGLLKFTCWLKSKVRSCTFMFSQAKSLYMCICVYVCVSCIWGLFTCWLESQVRTYASIFFAGRKGCTYMWMHACVCVCVCACMYITVDMGVGVDVHECVCVYVCVSGMKNISVVTIPLTILSGGKSLCRKNRRLTSAPPRWQSTLGSLLVCQINIKMFLKLLKN
jgi:hypothetical protein